MGGREAEFREDVDSVKKRDLGHVGRNLEAFPNYRECYEFMLAYTAQGCPATKALNPVNAFAKCWSVPHRGVRRTQERLSRFVKYQSLEPIEKRRSFIDVVERGARD